MRLPRQSTFSHFYVFCTVYNPPLPPSLPHPFNFQLISCFACISFIVLLSSVQSSFMASTSRQPQAELRHAFEEVAPSASTSGRSTKLPYDVFINHRGPDVKHTLAATLYNTLTGMGLRVFLDSEELELGDFLPREIEEAMRSASLHIAIFSKDYAQSPWCLAELSFMVKTGTQIVPIFYYVQPDDVRYAKGVYTDAFSRHKKKGRYSSEKLQEWKNALNNVSYNVGHIVNNKDDEGCRLKKIVNCVLKVIKNVPFVVAKYPLGLDEAVMDFEKILRLVESHSSVQIVGIWGMGGSGKTTLAKQLYNNKYKNMERSSFLLDVRDAASRNVLCEKQKKLLRDLGLKDVSIDNIEEGKGILSNRLRHVQVLIVLDDVDKVDQLDALVPTRDSLGHGSLIVVTTRERQVLRSWGISSIYKMKALDSLYAKQLFCWHAFLQLSPLPDFENLVEKFLYVCKGLPLSLQVFGAQLHGISDKDYWESQLDKISRILDEDIKEKLKVSYDALDDEERQMFLDSACFFIGEQKSSAIATWNGLGLSGLHGWEKLLNKCLVELDDQDRIRMHDHLRDLGRESANQNSPYRLWSPWQIVNVDNKAERIGIRGIMATTTGSKSEVEFPRCSRGKKLIINTSRGYCRLTPDSLGLKIFQVRGNDYNQVIGYTSRGLVWLRWFDPGQRNLHSLSSLKSLRVLELKEESDDENHLEELWETDSDGPVHLRELVIYGCSKFQGFPKSIGYLKDLKKIILVSGYNNKFEMKKLPESFCLLQSLEHLELTGCAELSSLPSNFGDLRNLRHLDLSDCIELRVLPDAFKNLTLLQHLCLERCYKLALESDLLGKMTKVEYLSLQGCKQLKEFLSHITNQASLRELNLFGTSIREIPMNINQLSKLQIFNVGSDMLTSLPTTLGDLFSLTHLTILHCSKLEFLPDSMGRLNLLETLECCCPIRNLDLNSLPRELNRNSKPSVSLCNLKQIYLCQTKVSKISISEDCCPCLETLDVRDNDHLTEIEALPTTIKYLHLISSELLTSINCIAGLLNIQTLWIEYCPKLDAFPSFAQFASLRWFELEGCYKVKKIQGLEHCRAFMETLRSDTRWEEAGLGTLERIEGLRSLHLLAMSRSGAEGSVQTMQKWSEDMTVYTWGVRGSGSVIDSFAFTNLSVIHSFSNQTVKSYQFLELSSNAHAILLCFVLNFNSPKDEFWIKTDTNNSIRLKSRKGKLVWIRVAIPRSVWHKPKKIQIKSFYPKGELEEEVERGMIAMGEEERVVEAFHGLWKLLSN